MIAYNTTYCINKNIETSWITWIEEVYMPRMLEEKWTREINFYKVHEEENPSGVTYALQYFFDQESQFESFLEKGEKKFNDLHHKAFKDQYVSFSTLLKVKKRLRAK